jgi:hypothetical protein
MSKTIKELAEQATTYEYGVDNGFDRATLDKEKFAALIVAQCIRAFGETRFEPSLEKYILTKLGIEK